MRRKRTRHPNYTPAVCMGVCALLSVWALGLLLHRCSARALEAVSGLSRRDLDADLAEGYLTANPLTGWQWVDEDQFWSAFDAMGRRAVVVTK